MNEFKVFNVAITPNPVNPDATWEILAKSIVDGSDGFMKAMEAGYETNIGDANNGGVLKAESLESAFSILSHAVGDKPRTYKQLVKIKLEIERTIKEDFRITKIENLLVSTCENGGINVQCNIIPIEPFSSFRCEYSFSALIKGTSRNDILSGRKALYMDGQRSLELFATFIAFDFRSYVVTVADMIEELERNPIFPVYDYHTATSLQGPVMRDCMKEIELLLHKLSGEICYPRNEVSTDVFLENKQSVLYSEINFYNREMVVQEAFNWQSQTITVQELLDYFEAKSIKELCRFKHPTSMQGAVENIVS